jgi:hypothetical protein
MFMLASAPRSRRSGKISAVPLAVLSFGLSSEYTAAPKVADNKRAKDIDADKQLYSRWEGADAVDGHARGAT